MQDCDIFEKDGDGDTVIDGEDSQLCVTTASCSSQNGSSSSVNAHDSFYSYDSPFSKLSPLSWAEEVNALLEFPLDVVIGRVTFLFFFFFFSFFFFYKDGHS